MYDVIKFWLFDLKRQIQNDIQIIGSGQIDSANMGDFDFFRGPGIAPTC